MKIELLSRPENAKKLCEMAAGTCVGHPEGTKNGLKHAIESGHESVLEHASYTFRISGVSRILLGQLVRHRVASFSVESQRYVRYEGDKIVVVEPDFSYIEKSPLARAIFRKVVTVASWGYDALLKLGVKPEDARYVLCESTTTTIVTTMNARELRHLFSLRCCNKAQWEIRNLADMMLACLRPEGLFDDAGAPCEHGACPESKPCGHPRTRK